MALTDENGTGMVMPVAPMYGGGYGNGGRYARGRTNARRDSMGRYSGERGYSRNDLSDKLRELMEDAPDEHSRKKIQRLIDDMDD